MNEETKEDLRIMTKLELGNEWEPIIEEELVSPELFYDREYKKDKENL